MSTAVAALVGLVVGAVGWMVLGHQRVTEALVEERRQAYASLLIEADLAASDTSADRKAFHAAVAKAELASSDRMRCSGRIQRIEKLIDGATWQDERAKFITVARIESLHNAFLRRWWHRGWYHNNARIERWLNTQVNGRGHTE